MTASQNLSANTYKGIVNSLDNPTAALIKTSECNLIAGNTNDNVFNSELSAEIDFWDQLTPDSEEWIGIIPTIHKNPYVRKYKRRHYTLSISNYQEYNMPIKEGFILEKVDAVLLKENRYENSEKLLEWVQIGEMMQAFKSMVWAILYIIAQINLYFIY